MSQVQRLLCCSPMLDDRIIISHRIPLITAFMCSLRESDSYHWFSRFLVMLSQEAQDFGRSVHRPLSFVKAGSGNDRLHQDPRNKKGNSRQHETTANTMGGGGGL